MSTDRSNRAAQVTPPSVETLRGADAHQALHRLRSTQPVCWLPELERWLVTEWAGVVEILRDWRRFTVDDPRFTTGQVVGPSMLTADGSEHRRHRAPFEPAFRPGPVNDRFTASIGRTVDRLFDELTAAGGGELRTELAAPLAVTVITDFLGLHQPHTDGDHLIDLVLGWYRQIVTAVEELTAGRSPSGGAAEAMADLARAVDEVVGQDRPDNETVLGRIARSGMLSRPELVGNTAVIMFGAIETSEAMTANVAWHLATNPDVVEAWRLDADGDTDTFSNRVVEESLRLEPAAAIVDRYTTEATAIGGVSLAAGDPVAVSLTAANRDPAVFADPDRFDPGRPGLDRHLAFVRGPHACLGLHLARLQTRLAVRRLLELWDRLDFDPDRLQAPTGLVFRKPAAIPVSVADR